MLTIENLKHPKLNIAHWHVSPKQNWCVMGRNGSGKQYLDMLLSGDLQPKSVDKMAMPAAKNVAVVSLEKQQEIYENELKIDATNFIDKNDVGTKVKDFLPVDKLSDPLIALFGLANDMEKGYRQLSTGEGRKVLLLQAVLSLVDQEGNKLIVCDNPFDSLDKASCIALSTALEHLSNRQITVLLLLSNRQDIPHWCTHISLIAQGQLSAIGQLTESETVRQLDDFFKPVVEQDGWPEPYHKLSDYQQSYLVKLNNGKVSYGGKSVFENLDVTIKPLQHTLITGANGSGKSTLLQLITGDCPQCYSNDLHVLGYKRGSGESIWQLKKHMGIVSAELHRQYRVNSDLLTVVVSGFYDSIGLYQQPEQHKTELARQWLKKVGLLQYQHTSFQSLSYGEQRLALIARALVKSPYLLILDEPTQGLDEVNRQRVLNFITHLESQRHSTMLLVSHREDEYLPLFKQRISL
ncbi:ATP-binding cassette domain-containing protein [Colwellia piezophila]|uniref:ATP-binding cassette domain-containing protein n=1 Tax=Colwellia piezophila TaxID=211668 RepID=UPI00035D661E|nr:ATP-binding cassette domain-containing protein [Colwellia piezophila]